jgi:uncharacterized damage-inducible protein DinB
MKIVKDDIARLWTFHHWATGKVFDALATVSSPQLDQKWGGSFDTGRGLLEHVVGADTLWIDRLNGTSPKALPNYPRSFAGSGFRDAWLEIESRQRRFIETLTAAQLAEDFTYTNLKGETTTWPLADVLFHIVNHGSYHRGQITQLLRDLGMSAPSTDYIVFLKAH